MGIRDDDLLTDERADEVLKRLLEANLAAPSAALPDDFVARTLRRLPAVPPAQALELQAARSRWARVGAACLLLPVALLAIWNVGSVAGDAPQMAYMLGDGRSGVSSALLSLQLAAKPFWNTVSGSNAAPLFGLLLGAGVVALVWWRTVRASDHVEFAEDD